MDTEELFWAVDDAKDIEEFKQKCLGDMKEQKEMWKEKIEEIIDKSGLSVADFAKACNVKRQTVYGWRKGAIPRDREAVKRAGMAAGYGEDEINALLGRYAHCRGLYSKNLEDCACKFVVNHMTDGTAGGKSLLEKYDEILKTVEDASEKAGEQEGHNVTTVRMDKSLDEVQNVDELEQFVMDWAPAFPTAYDKLYTFVNTYIEAAHDEREDNDNSMADLQGWTAGLVKSVGELHYDKRGIPKEKKIPTREALISLALHFDMDLEDVDEMFDLAHMEHLYSKNVFEGVVMFALQFADKKKKELNKPREQELWYVDDVSKLLRKIIIELDIPELNDFYEEVSLIGDHNRIYDMIYDDEPDYEYEEYDPDWREPGEPSEDKEHGDGPLPDIN